MENVCSWNGMCDTMTAEQHQTEMIMNASKTVNKAQRNEIVCRRTQSAWRKNRLFFCCTKRKGARCEVMQSVVSSAHRWFQQRLKRWNKQKKCLWNGRQVLLRLLKSTQQHRTNLKLVILLENGAHHTNVVYR